MTAEEIRLLAKYMAEVWKTYCKYLQIDMQQWDWDRLRDELDRIWEESGRNPLILDSEMAYAADIERRQKNGKDV